ncbi:HSP20 family molecular chaperone IbpA [Catenuloplanes nepalensis]|uniref:HSP20 family molecular chaperone IbpA n=1 Tax=Catenuloplanes nepalensis TaxID=587533 RepID=A0ABT9MVE3_9ACTN|nr:Hsp20/alpha crystallin family protein [Catenuloplanes nepalensis]MDP9795419.1 HSP20 family molecular chaperone IbpA [Catenuloplanes nepalensis]
MSNTIWTRRDPFADFDALVRNAFGPAALTAARSAGFTPAAEVLRDGDDAVVRLELPGVDAENDVTVEVDGGRLTVRGERRDERAEQRDGRSLREVRYGTFRRSFGLPQHVTSEAVSATYDAGVLSVRVTGAYTGREARRIPVTAGAPATPVEASPVAAVEATPAEQQA